ncbi:MAG: hypothetical protein ACM3TR_07185 [Caulobacteraceae bacterium]
MNFDFSYPDIINQCNYMVYLNAVSFCLLSGCGNIEMPHEHELNMIYKLLKGTKENEMPKNIMFMSSLYRKCMPFYAGNPEPPFDFKAFHWDNRKVKRVIEPDVLCYSIYCMTALVPVIQSSEFLLDHKDFITYCLGTSSIKQANFLLDFLRIGDFYYQGEDTGENSYGEYRIIINTENPDLKVQFLAAEALSSVIKLVSTSECYDTSLCAKFEKGLEILPIICENVVESVNDISSRDLAVICLSLLSILNNIKLYGSLVYSTVNIIGLELYERIHKSGDIARNSGNDEGSSFITLCNCMNCFIRLYQINCIEEYRNAYMKLYDRIDSYWDGGIGLFITTSKNKQRFSIRDIGCIFSALKALRSCQTDPDLFMHVDRQLSAFYSSAVMNSKIFNSQSYPILQKEKVALPNFGTVEKSMAPVFSKSFETKVSKRKYYCEPDVFQADVVLLGCKYLLY